MDIRNGIIVRGESDPIWLRVGRASVSCAGALLTVLCSVSAPLAQPGLVVSGLAEWGLSLDRKQSDDVAQGSNAASQAYQFSLRGPLPGKMQFSSSVSLSTWDQSFQSSFVPRFSQKAFSFSNSLVIPLRPTLSLSLRQISFRSRSASDVRYNTLGATLRGVLFRSGPTFTLDGQQYTQDLTLGNSVSRVATQTQTFRMDKSSRRFSFDLEQTLNRQQLPGTQRFISLWSLRVRPVWRMSESAQFVARYTLNGSPGSLVQAGAVDLTHNLTSRRGYSAGVQFTDNRRKSAGMPDGNLGAVSGAASGWSMQNLTRSLSYAVRANTRITMDRLRIGGVGVERVGSFITLDNNLQKIWHSWMWSGDYGVTLENIRSRLRQMGSRHVFRTSARRLRSSWLLKADYVYEVERTDLNQSRHQFVAEIRKPVTPRLMFSLSGHANYNRVGRSNGNVVGDRRELSIQSGLDMRRGLQTLSLQYQYQVITGEMFRNKRSYLRALFNWPLRRVARVEGEARLIFESLNRSRSLFTQMVMTWPVAAMELSATLRYQHVAAYSATTSGGYVGFRLSRRFLRAF